MHGWQFWIDRGGTFTDVIGLAPDGELHVRKVLSAVRPGECDPGLAAVRSLLRTARAAAAAPGAAASAVLAVKVGTTVATNALLERRGEPVLLVTTEGLADQLAIGDQHRPELFALRIVRPERLYARVIEARERIDAAGEVLRSLDVPALRRELQAAWSAGFRALAIVFLHGWRHGAHEQLAAALAREVGFTDIAVSHEISPLARYVPRGQTTVLGAYLEPTLRRYLQGLQHELRALQTDAAVGARGAEHAPIRLELMQSHGGLAEAAGFRASESLLSGPAGGLVGATHVARRLGIARVVSFDMGGTSTDVAVADGALPHRFEHDIGGVHLQTPMLDVHTIAAGGGSVLSYRDGRLRVGPESAGAHPGPACYGRGGPLTLTDAQVLLGRLRPDTLPHSFGADGSQAIDAQVVVERFAELAGRIADRLGDELSPEALADSFVEVAVASMANAIRHVCLRQGLDVTGFTLLAFGGAAGQHACRVARAAGLQRVLVHPLGSVLSAYGIGVAERTVLLRASVHAPLDARGLAAADAQLGRLEAQALAQLEASDRPADRVRLERLLELRTGDSETALAVAWGSLGELTGAFADAHRRRFGFEPQGPALSIEAVRLEARCPSVDPAQLRAPAPAEGKPLPSHGRAWFGTWLRTPLVSSACVTELTGPALVVEPHSTLVLEPGWTARRLPGGEILAEDAAAEGRSVGALAAAARTEVFDNLFMHIAEQMGEVLRQSAQSVNIKERLDYSCALFDARGALIANAPHMPVHLGSMGASVRAVIEAHGAQLRPGAAWLLNSPYHGGTHLPDMTVVSPVFLSRASAKAVSGPDFFVASRAHHADIGGVSPGSMPAHSAHIDEEGVLIEDFALLEDGRLRERELLEILRSGPYPARNPAQNLADLRAQLAANARGHEELARAAHEHGLQALGDAMQRVQQNAAECVREALAALAPGAFRCEMDGGQVIAVRIDIDRERKRARIDFSGTSAQGRHNFNAPRAVCVAAVLYVFRTLVARPIPLNEGCLEPLEIIVPRGCMLDPVAPAAVAAGNVETSQVIVDALYGALGVLAASQGTMNNLTFGNAQLQYYETIAGGSGAGASFDGCDAVQTHMTNSRLTDPEILEERFPVLVREFRIRRGAGGAGAHRGGDGIVRQIEFRAPCTGALLANRHRIAPFGIAGGAAALPGAARLLRATGSVEALAATARFELLPGDRLEILTPGGGGFGTPSAAQD
ncbi:MAG TPA: hydantoinase B/oxoprolinase family protein [Steroidobacteraceae bacterium]|nr:hydantoinase B/oxoprolinase family protein [Steroidobacteraceae bacterium]